MSSGKSDSKDREPASSYTESTPEKPLIFISHDSRDAELARAFSVLVRSVTAGMIDTFRSSDREGKEGIEFGDDWFKTIMEKLDSAREVVCLFTRRSLDRPWILFEAGVAKGKINSAVFGIALGIPLSEVSKSGPFYQFQNLSADESDLVKLVKQLAGKVKGLEPDETIIKEQVGKFIETSNTLLESQQDQLPSGITDIYESGAAAKLLEELKSVVRELPFIVERGVAEISNPRNHAFRRKLHPMMFEELMFSNRDQPSPVLRLLMATSVFKDDLPWLHELGLEIFRASMAGQPNNLIRSIKLFEEALEATVTQKWSRHIVSSKEVHMLLGELIHMLPMFLEEISPEYKSNRDTQSKNFSSQKKLNKE